jgi:hypothetical protein
MARELFLLHIFLYHHCPLCCAAQLRYCTRKFYSNPTMCFYFIIYVLMIYLIMRSLSQIYSIKLLNGEWIIMPFEVIRLSNPITGLDRPWGFQEVKAPRFQDVRHVKVVRLLAARTGHFTPWEIFVVLISVRGWVDPWAVVRPEGLCQWKIPVTPSGIVPATYQLVAQCLSQLRHRVSPRLLKYCWRNPQ